MWATNALLTTVIGTIISALPTLNNSVNILDYPIETDNYGVTKPAYLT